MEIPDDLLYTGEHEWLRVNGARGVVGITAFAQEQLGDVVFVELPDVGRQVTGGNTFGVVESVKTVSDLYAPAAGTVTAVNKDLEANPEQVNREPYGNGWIIEIELSNPDELKNLLSAEQYAERVREES
ncbi:MAG: glycine cleavage system protein GcvH [Nitrospinales bacterium]